MSGITKKVSKIHVPDSCYEIFDKDLALKTFQNLCDDGFVELEEELTMLLQDKTWLKMESLPVYYWVPKHFLMPDPDYERERYVTFVDVELSEYSELQLEFCGFSGKILEREMVKEFCFKDTESIFFRRYQYVLYAYARKAGYYYLEGEEKESASSFFGPMRLGSRYVYYVPAYELESDGTYLEIFVKNNLMPTELSEEAKRNFEKLQKLYHAGYVKIGESVQPTQKAIDEILKKGKKTVNGIKLYPKDMKKQIDNMLQEQDFKIDLKNGGAEILKYLLDCDKRRVDLESYDLKRLEDPQLGHWELWSDEYAKAQIEGQLWARNPIADIREDGIVGIDFGTKSTIVAYQDGNDTIQPMRIGVGKLSKAVKDTDFENPTVMEFLDLNHFLQEYQKVKGRPYTEWNDLTISHTANHSLVNIETKSDEYYSFFYDLKQWAGDASRQIRIKDKNGHDRVLPSFMEIPEGEFDPIEIYAYYIGLYINNMRNGIYLRYLLSFPVTYEKDVREKILRSFERGIKKSLPTEILENEDAMNKFYIRQGASEPAAYAICALQQYGFDPEEGENIFYGIFDFGGGTTDFDFGIWKSVDEESVDYEIKHFGSQGDRYLGGETLLETLAYTVFCDNLELCREQKIVFQIPTGTTIIPENMKAFVNESQEAKMNMKQMVEHLRPFWERKGDEHISAYAEGIRLALFDRNGEPKMNLCFNVQVEKLDKILYERIQEGIDNFFVAFTLIFDSKRIFDTGEAQKINIFLAGNSSKSPIVQELFHKRMKEMTEQISERAGGDVGECFRLYPALGTSEAELIQAERGVEQDTYIIAPTGKTGVAFGLLEGRPGGRIRVISENDEQHEAKFAYFLGINKKKKFHVQISREREYHKWMRFINAESEIIELYYTDLPEAATNKLSIKGVSRKTFTLKQTQSGASVYIRFVKPKVIEYAVGMDEENVDEQNAVQVQLN